MTTPIEPEPESHPAGYEYRERFPDLHRYRGFEGGAVYVASDAQGYYVITDEWMVAEFLDEDLDTVHIYRFDSKETRDSYCAERFGQTRHSADDQIS